MAVSGFEIPFFLSQVLALEYKSLHVAFLTLNTLFRRYIASKVNQTSLFSSEVGKVFDLKKTERASDAVSGFQLPVLC